MSALRLRRVGVALGGREVVRDVSLTVPAGRWAALIGPNGAGKTTLLRAVAGAVRHAGTIELGDRDAASLARRERARLVAVVPQLPTAPPDMGVADYVLLGRTPHLGYLGAPGPRDHQAVARALRRLDLERFADRDLASLSGGERQRAILARAVAQEAPVLLLDEPTSALDLARQQQVLELVDALRREEGLTVLAAMHDLTSVALYADDVHLLDAGRTVASGTPGDVLRAGTLSRSFGAAVRVLEHDGALHVVPVRAGASSCRP